LREREQVKVNKEKTKYDMIEKRYKNVIERVGERKERRVL
jgi:hypothetical protein